jgi:DNA polymerase (family X)
MDNYSIADHFSLLAKLMDIHGENSFKAKSYSSAAFTIEKLPLQLSETPQEKIAGIKGIGDSTAKKILELLQTGKLKALEEIIAATPPGIIEMLGIKGIGPKKIATIWKELEIETIGELLYACNENRLTLYKGFGEKTQNNIRDSIQFYMSHQGHFLFSQAEALVPAVEDKLVDLFTRDAVRLTGAFRRQAPTIEEIEFVIAVPITMIEEKMAGMEQSVLKEKLDDQLLYLVGERVRLLLYACEPDTLAERMFFTTGSAAFNEAFRAAFPSADFSNATSEEDIFTELGIPYIPPYLRETAAVIEKAKANTLPSAIIQADSIRGIIHSHSNWSDGSNTLEEMAVSARDKGLEYLVISDHSKSAFYANGLQEDRIRAQHQQIEELNQQLAPFKIFKSIESDILNDGSLDYPDAVLATFDLVIASVHSNLKMNEEKAMMRLLNAIANPYTTILGHPTGRLLLSRNGYPVDHKAIIDACAKHKVVIELNAHPSRLDIDWRYIDYAIEQNVLISIDPDAHTIDGFDDCRYGVLVAQKGGLTASNNLSSFSLTAFEAFITNRKKEKGLI